VKTRAPTPLSMREADPIRHSISEIARRSKKNFVFLCGLLLTVFARIIHNTCCDAAMHRQ